MKTFGKCLLILGLAGLVGGCASADGNHAASAAPTVSGYISTSASTTFH